MTLTEKYQIYKTAENKWNDSKQIGIKKNIKVTCSCCNKQISYIGCSSHLKICKNIMMDKAKAFKNYFGGNDNCLVCNKELVPNKQGRIELYCCSKKCKFDLHKFIHSYEFYYKICPICNNEFIGKYATCSRECGYKLSSKSLVDWHFENKDTDEYKERLKKIGDAGNFSNYLKTHGAWNKGMFGEEYLSHYDKEDGTNSLIEGIKRTNFLFRKTKPEIKIDNLLNELQIDYRYNIFHKNKQFDFSLRFNDFMIILEVDGDYWHKSILKCNDETERKIQRQIDKLKEKIIIEENNKINKFDREWFVIRFWEYDINNNIEVIKQFLSKLKNTGNKDDIRNIICEIKEYYSEKS